MLLTRRNCFYSGPRTGLLRIILQNFPATKEIAIWLIPIASFAFLLIFLLFAIVVLPLVYKHHTVEYGHMVGGSGKNVNSLLDGRILTKIIKELEKLEFEGRIGSRKNQRLLEAVDKNERRNVFHAFFYFIMT